MNNRLKQAASWYDDLIPVQFQGWVRVLVIILALRHVGIDVTPINDVIKGIAGEVDVAKEVAESNAVTLAAIEASMSNVVDRAYATRRATWTLSNDLARIEKKIDRLIEVLP